MEGAAATPKMEWEATDLVTAWQSFKQHADFWFAGPLSGKEEAEKCSYLMIWIGDKGRDIYSTWNLKAADQKKLQILIDGFENHVRPKSNKIFSRYKFWKRHQKDTETFEQYFTDLKLLVKDCAYTDQEEMIRDAIVFGVKDGKVREKCINEGSELTQEKAVNFARTSELSKSQLKSMNQDEDKSVNMLKQKGAHAQAQSGKKSQYNYKKKSKPWQQNSFEQLKSLAVNAPILQYYDPKKPLTMSVDSSSSGLGAVLIQDEKPIAYGSRALTDTQKKYPQIEKETLAILYGCHKFHHYVYGREVEVETDHKPLQSIYKKPLLQAPPRLQRLLLALQKYDLNVNYKPGKEMFLADHLSRSHLKETKEQLVPDLQVNDIHLISHLPVAPETYKRFQEETASDEELKQLQDIVLEGWPENRSDLPQSLYKYWNFRDEISCVDGLLYKSHKVMVPKSLQFEMLDKIHASHLGIIKCTSRAREVLFWVGMARDIEERVKACGICSLNQNANAKEPMLMPDIPERPWSKLGVDLFEYQSHHYLLVVDYYSKWPEVVKLDKLTSKNTIDHMKGLFSRYGYPDIVFTDNGPQFSSLEFKLFSKEFAFVHSTSSPRFPQSNGQAERTVQTVKNLIKKSKDPHTALLDYRNTPLDIGLSPAQLFLNRRLKTSLPTSAPLLSPKHINVKEVQNRLKTRQMKYKEYFDRHSRELRPLKIGEPVVMLTGDKWSQAKVVEKHTSPRSYIVETSSGNKLRRNRKHLKPTKYCATSDNQDSQDLADKVFESQNVQLQADNQDVEQNETVESDNDKSCEDTMEVIKPSNVTRAGRKIIIPGKFKDFEMSK